MAGEAKWAPPHWVIWAISHFGFILPLPVEGTKAFRSTSTILLVANNYNYCHSSYPKLLNSSQIYLLLRVLIVGMRGFDCWLSRFVMAVEAAS